MDLKVVANEMLPVYENQTGERLVDAREMHGTLMVGKDFSTWIKQRIDQYGFVENEDFTTILGNSVKSTIGANVGRQRKDYLFTLDSAKEIAMVENNEMGRAIRKYFIKVEKLFRQQQKPQTQAEMMLMFAQQMVENEKKVNQLEQKLTDVTHRIDNFDSLDTIGDLQQRLNAMIRKYATTKGLSFQQSWREFRTAFNTAYRTNVTMLIENYKMKHALKTLTLPQYLSMVSRLEDAIRVADKLLNKQEVI